MKKITESQLKDKVSSLREYLTAYENENQLLAENPYAGADAEKFARLSPEDQAWYTKGGGKPDLNDPIIASRAPNKGKLGPAKTRGLSAEPTPAAPATNAMGVAPTANVPGMVPATAPAATPAAPATNAMGVATQANVPGMVPAPALTAADQEDADLGAAMRANGSLDATTQSAPAAPGPQATKIARFKELIDKAKEKRTDAEVQASKDLGAAMMPESTTYFLNKLRLIENQQLNEVLTPEEQKEMDALNAELGQQGAESDPELSALINDYNSLKSTAAPTAPAAAAGPMSNVNAAVTAASTPPAGGGPIVTTSPSQAAAVTASGPVTWKQIYELNKDIIGANPNLIKPGQQLKMPDGSTYPVQAGDNLSKIAKKAGGGQGAKVAPTQPATSTTPANPNGAGRDPRGAYRGDRTEVTPTAPGTVPGQNARDDLLARSQAPKSPSGTTNTTTNQSVQGTMKMGKPDGPIQYNGKNVNPGDPEYAAASQALIKAQGGAQRYRTAGERRVDQNAASSGAPVTMGAVNADKKDFEESVGYNELQRIVSLINHR